MKKADLIKLLDVVPDDAEIVVKADPDDICGYYGFDSTFYCYCEDAKRNKNGGLKCTYSNDVNEEDKSVYVWVLGW